MGSKIVFYVLLVIIIALILILLFLLFKFKFRRNHRNAVYSELNAIAKENDFLLVNDLAFFLHDDIEAGATIFDHILFGEKYIYVIKDFDKEGGLFGNAKDESLLINNNGQTFRVANPIYQQGVNVRLLEDAIGVKHNQNLLVPIVVYNNDLCVGNNLREKSNESCFIPLKELRATIKTAERDNVQPFSHESTEKLIMDLKTRSEKIKADYNINIDKGGMVTHGRH